MKIDKENDYVSYNDDAHKYWTKSGEDAISVTTLIDKFGNFDKDFWSSYKALQALIGDTKFNKIKTGLQKAKMFDISILGDYNISIAEFEAQKRKTQNGWKKKADESCERGSAIHKNHETGSLNGIDPELKYLGFNQKDFSLVTDNKIQLTGNHIYPEVLLSYEYDGIWIAGQADKIISVNGEFTILDYKTNAKIDKTGFFDSAKHSTTKMKYPLDTLEDCNFEHYEMQLSTYAYMIEKMGGKIKDMYLIHYDHSGKCTWLKCEYLRDLVIKMLNEHKRMILNERFEEDNKPIVY